MCVCVLCRVLSKVPGWDFAPFSSLIWSECCSASDKTSVCSKLDAGVGRQIWEIFITLDVDSQVKITTIEMSKCVNVYSLILAIYMYASVLEDLYNVYTYWAMCKL